jgi:uncharacterized protein (TIGR04141 family)
MRPERALLLLELEQEKALSRSELLNFAKFSPLREMGVQVRRLNSHEVVEIRTEQVFAGWHLASERAPKVSSIRKFGIKFDRDLLGMIGGVSSNKTLGGTVRGSSSLRVKHPIANLEDLLETVLDLFSRDDYKKAWPEIDNISPIHFVQSLTRALRFGVIKDMTLLNGIAATSLGPMS